VIPSAGTVLTAAATAGQAPGLKASPRPSEFLPRPVRNADLHTLSTSEAIKVLGLSRRDLADLTDAGWLRPAGRPSVRRWPLGQIQALLNTSTAGTCPAPARPRAARRLHHALSADPPRRTFPTRMHATKPGPSCATSTPMATGSSTRKDVHRPLDRSLPDLPLPARRAGVRGPCLRGHMKPGRRRGT
jgi:hypothetical protein